MKLENKKIIELKPLEQNVRKHNPQDEIVQEVKHYMQRKAASEKQSINYRKMYAA